MAPPSGTRRPSLAAYNGVIDTADVHGWRSMLDRDPKNGTWWLWVTDGARTLAKASSKSDPPAVFVDLGIEVGAELERSGRLST